MTQRDVLVSTWIEFHAGISEKARWAFDELQDLIQSNPEEAWAVIKDIFNSSSSEDIRKNLAAGPIEDLLHDHGGKFIGELEVLSRQNPIFGKMIKGVWCGEMPKEVQAKVKEIQAKYGNAV